MWKSFKINEKLYLISIEELNEQFRILITDLIELWQTELALEDLMRLFKEENPSIEATPLIVRSNVLDLPKNIAKTKVSLDIQESQLSLNLEQGFEELTQEIRSQSILYKFKLQKTDQNEFKSIITIPIIQMVHVLEEQQNLLIAVIKNKDRELQEYQMEKGDISRGDLKTEPFDTELLKAGTDKLFFNTFSEPNFKEFWKKFEGENGHTSKSNLSVGTEPWNQVKKRKKVYNSKTVIKKGSGVKYPSPK